MLTETSDYDALYRDFRWEVSTRFNIATVACDRYADGSGRHAHEAVVGIDVATDSQRKASLQPMPDG